MGWVQSIVEHLHRRYPRAGWTLNIGWNNTFDNTRIRRWREWWAAICSRLQFAQSSEEHDRSLVGNLGSLPLSSSSSPVIPPFDPTQERQICLQFVTSPHHCIPNLFHNTRRELCQITRIIVARNSDLRLGHDGYRCRYQELLGIWSRAVILGNDSRLLTATAANPSMFSLRHLQRRSWYWTIITRRRLLSIQREYVAFPRTYVPTECQLRVGRKGRLLPLMRLVRAPCHVPQLRLALEVTTPTVRFAFTCDALEKVGLIRDLAWIVLAHLWCCWICYAPSTIETTILAHPHLCTLTRRRRWKWWSLVGRRLRLIDQEVRCPTYDDEVIY